MASQQEHENAWQQNRKFLATISKEFPDWTITVAFYAALHAIEWLLTKEGISCQSHVERNQVLKQTNRYQNIWKHYQPLYSASITSRYKSSPNQFDIEQTRQFVNDNLLSLERSVFKLLELEKKTERISWIDEKKAEEIPQPISQK